MHHDYDPGLFLLSLAVSFLGSLTGLRTGARAIQSTGRRRAAWIACAAVALGGCAIWSMHFVGMLALQMPGHDAYYDLPLTLVSLALAIGFTALGLALLSRFGCRPGALALAGLAMGCGVAGMHYLGMAAMRVHAAISYDPAWVLLSVGIAIGAAIAALWLVFNARSLWMQLAGAGAMAAGVAGMHYTAMAAAMFDLPAHGHSAGGGLAEDLVAIAVTAAVLLVVVIGVAAAIIDKRFAAQADLMRQLEEARERAETAARARQDFLATMSHEIRTPLTGILGVVDILAQEDLTARQKSYVESIRASGRHLLNVLNDILDFSRIESGRLELEQIDFSLPLVFERLRSLVQPLAVERGLQLRFELSEHSPPVVNGDPTRLKQILLNLAGNAIKFTERGHVTIAVSCRGEDERYRVRFEVRDTGIGIAPEQQASLFTAFAQADRSTTRQYGGSGLGLAICHRLVDAMDGQMGVESRPGEGSTFWFEVPLAPGDAARAAPRDGTAPVAAPCAILVAEDVELNRTIIRTVLERDGHDVTFANNGAEALALVQQAKFRLILMDIQMPVMDGVEATRRIRDLPGAVSTIPIVALTANVMAAEQERYLAAGMNDCLTKPIDWDRLRSLLAQLSPAAAEPLASASGADPAQADTRPGLDPAMIQQLSLLEQSAPGLIANLAELFVADTEKRLGDMQQAATMAQADELARQAHATRGGAANIGAARMADASGALEDAAKSGDLAGARDLLARLADEFARTRVALSQLVTACAS